jgi:hypothetical protein
VLEHFPIGSKPRRCTGGLILKVHRETMPLERCCKS